MCTQLQVYNHSNLKFVVFCYFLVGFESEPEVFAGFSRQRSIKICVKRWAPFGATLSNRYVPSASSRRAVTDCGLYVASGGCSRAFGIGLYDLHNSPREQAGKHLREFKTKDAESHKQATYGHA